MKKLLIILFILGVKFECCQMQDLTDASQALARFSGEIYNYLAKQSSTNLVFSPVSLHAALSILSVGATPSSETQRQLLSLLSADLNLDVVKFEDAHRSLSKYLADKMSYANFIWVKQGSQLNEKFKERINKFDVKNDEIDFGNEKEAVKEVNRWVNQTTSGLIPKMLKNVDPATQCLIVNALYTKSMWTKPFKLAKTNTNFTKEDNSVVDIKPMERQDRDFTYGSISYGGGEHKVLKIPTKDSSFELIIVLPSYETGLAAFDGKSGDQTLYTALQNAKYKKREVFVSMPKFKIESSITANDLFKSLGVKRVFTGESELSILKDSANLRVGDIKHKAVISVDEKGVEAAAVTVIGIVPFSISDIKSFVVNRPFLFVLHDAKHKLPIIMGRIVDPTA